MEIKNIKSNQKLVFLQNLTKAYTEGVYADTPANRKLGRVGMSYKEWTQKQQGGGNEQRTKEPAETIKNFDFKKDFEIQGKDEKTINRAYNILNDYLNDKGDKQILNKKFNSLFGYRSEKVWLSNNNNNDDKSIINAFNDGDIARIYTLYHRKKDSSFPKQIAIDNFKKDKNGNFVCERGDLKFVLGEKMSDDKWHGCEVYYKDKLVFEDKYNESIGKMNELYDHFLAKDYTRFPKLEESMSKKEPAENNKKEYTIDNLDFNEKNELGYPSFKDSKRNLEVTRAYGKLFVNKKPFGDVITLKGNEEEKLINYLNSSLDKKETNNAKIKNIASLKEIIPYTVMRNNRYESRGGKGYIESIYEHKQDGSRFNKGKMVIHGKELIIQETKSRHGEHYYTYFDKNNNQFTSKNGDVFEQIYNYINS